MICPQTARLWGSTAAVADSEVILVASHGLCKESSSSSSSAWGGRERKKKCSARGSWQHAATRLQTLSPRTADCCHVKGNGSVHLLKPCIRYSFETQQTVKAHLLGASFLMSCHKPVHTDGTEGKKTLVFFSSCITSFI